MSDSMYEMEKDEDTSTLLPQPIELKSWFSRVPRSTRYRPIFAIITALLLAGSIYFYIDNDDIERLLPDGSESTPDGQTTTLAGIYQPYFPQLSLPPLVTPDPSLSNLTDRLQLFLNRPILSYSESLAASQCPVDIGDRLVDRYQLRDNHKFWRRMSRKTIAQKRAALVSWIEDVSASGKSLLGTAGERGIVLTGGNKDTTERMITLLRILRRYGCQLPVEVFHFDGELTDTLQRDTIESLGARILLVKAIKDNGWKNFQIKGLALVQSSFQEILYLDSDNIPLRDPTYLFSTPHYLTHTAVFWPDITKDHPKNAIWRLIGEPCTLNDWTFESGQILINKAGNDGLNLAALWLAAGMMNDKAFWFRMCGGDKDTFRWAFRILGLDWGRSLRWMSPLGFINNGRFCGHTMLQYDIVAPAAPLFVHSNLLKHLSPGATSTIYTTIKRLQDDTYNSSTANNVNIYLYTGKKLGGGCLDIEMEGGIEEEFVLSEFKQFEEVFVSEGGKVGGWN